MPTDPRVLYAIGSRLGGPGIGTTAAHAIAGIEREGLLQGVICLGHEPNAPGAGVADDVRFLPDRARRVVPDRWYWLAKNLVFDRAVGRRLPRFFHGATARGASPDAPPHVHAWNTQASNAIRRAKAHGARVVVDRASTHILTQVAILREAYARHGLVDDSTPAAAIRRALSDYEVADVVAVPSEPVRESFLAHGYPRERLYLNRFGHRVAERIPERAPRRPGDPLRVLFVGQVGVRKGALELLQAWDAARIPGARLSLAGGAEPAAARHISRYAGRDDIAFLGFRNDVPRLMAEHDVFCFPTWEEGSALVTFEAMAHGMAMVTTRAAGSVAIDESSALFVEPGDVRNIADALCRLADEPGTLAALSGAARADVAAYRWEAYGERTAALHRALAEGRLASLVSS
ncbi:glycosyltransferase family 4 protein [bacterium]|nr:glycosyltransferase family 4 protein [bacterium]